MLNKIHIRKIAAFTASLSSFASAVFFAISADRVNIGDSIYQAQHVLGVLLLLLSAALWIVYILMSVVNALWLKKG